MARKSLQHSIQRYAPTLPSALNPFTCAQAPLGEIPCYLNPFAKDGVRIFLWLAYLLPLGNLKLYPAFLMLLDAAETGRLDGVHTLVEASSGNLIHALAILALYFGIKNVVAIMPADMPMSKRERLYYAGIPYKNMIDVNEVPGEPTAIEHAAHLGEQKGWLNLGQYRNKKNPESHAIFTGPSIWEQLTRITNVHGETSWNIFSAGRGTNGTAVGIRNYCESKGLSTRFIGSLCAEGNPVPGIRSRSRIIKDGFDWEARIVTSEVTQHRAYLASFQLGRAGFPTGPASGVALTGLCQFLFNAKTDGSLEALRGPLGTVTAVVACGDGADLYRDKYSTILNPEDFAVRR